MPEVTFDIGIIDNNPTIVRRLPSGQIHSLRKKIMLTPGEHWFPTPVEEEGKWDNKKALTARAYDLIRGIMGVSIITPDTIIDSEGRSVGNPIIVRKHGLVETIQYRVIAVGRGPAGNWSAVDLTFVYSAQAYMAYDLYSKWCGLSILRDVAPSPQPWGTLVRSDDPLDPGYISFPVATQGMSLAVKMDDPAVLPLWKDYQESQKFAERNCHSMAVRNAMRKFTGITYAEEDGSVTVTVWPQPDVDIETLGSLRIDGEVIPVDKVIDDADHESMQASRESDEKHAVEESSKPIDEEATKESVRNMIRDAIKAIPGGLKSDAVAVATKSLGFSSPAEVSKKADLATLQKFLSAIE